MASKLEKDLIEAFHRDLQEGIKHLAKKYNLDVRKVKTSYGEFDMKCSIVVEQAKDEGSKASPVEAAAAERFADSYGIDSKLINKPFRHAGSTYELIGINSRNRKFPVICLIDGNRFKMTVKSFNFHYNMSKVAA